MVAVQLLQGLPLRPLGGGLAGPLGQGGGGAAGDDAQPLLQGVDTLLPWLAGLVEEALQM